MYITFTLRQWTGRVEREHIFFSHDDWGQSHCHPDGVAPTRLDFWGAGGDEGKGRKGRRQEGKGRKDNVEYDLVCRKPVHGEHGVRKTCYRRKKTPTEVTFLGNFQKKKKQRMQRNKTTSVNVYTFRDHSTVGLASKVSMPINLSVGGSWQYVLYLPALVWECK